MSYVISNKYSCFNNAIYLIGQAYYPHSLAGIHGNYQYWFTSRERLGHTSWLF